MMPITAKPSFIASLYERQSLVWHPLSWPKGLLQAPGQALRKLEISAAHTDVHGVTGFGLNVLRGATGLAASPLALGLALPASAALLGGAAPLVVAAGASALALGAGAGGLAHVKELEHWFAGPSRAPNLWHQTLAAVMSYGVVGCTTELLGASLGRYGARLRNQEGAGAPKRALGWGLEILGYSTALLTGAVLTVARLAVATIYAAVHGVLLTVVAALGAGYACVAHVVGAKRHAAPETPAEPTMAADPATAAASSPDPLTTPPVAPKPTPSGVSLAARVEDTLDQDFENGLGALRHAEHQAAAAPAP